MVKETAAADRVHEFFGFSAPLRGKNGAHGRAFVRFSSLLRIDGGEGGEIVLAHDLSRGGGHGSLVQRIRMVVHVAREERGTDGAAINAIAVSLGASRLAGVEIRSDFFNANDTYRRGKDVIQSNDEVLRWDWIGNGTGGDLGQGMDAGVGTS